MKKLVLVVLLSFLIIALFGCSNKKKEYEFIVEDTIVTTGKFKMNAKLTIPVSKKSVPAVVMVHGSGPQDMDETINSLKPFKDLAEALAKKGIASLRYDKITYTHINELVKEYDFTIYEEVVYDALSAVNLLKDNSKIDANNIFILGHSLGAQFSPIILNEDSSINGAIMLAGTPRHLLDVLIDQVKIQSEDVYKQIYPIYEYIRNLKEVVAGEEKQLYFGCYQKYWVHYNGINIESETIKASEKHPLLIMQGGLDLQVAPSTQDLYKTILKDNPKVVYKYYDLLNHCFVDGSGETIANAYTFEKQIPDEVIMDIVSFIKDHKR